MPLRNLKEFETYIKVKARSMARRHDDIEDFEQEGRLAAWQAICDDPVATKSYVQKRINWRMIDFMQRKIYKNPAEISADDVFGNLLYGDYTLDEM